MRKPWRLQTYLVYLLSGKTATNRDITKVLNACDGNGPKPQ